MTITEDNSVNFVDSDFNADELIRYARHFTLPQVGSSGQKKLKAARVLCVGAGGLGSPALLYLTAAGIGTLGIIDQDQVELSNLQRQVLYGNQDLKIPKVTAAQNQLKKINPNVNFNLYQQNLTNENALEIIADYDVVIGCVDNFPTRYLINDTCFYLKKPNVYASVMHFEGQCSVFLTGKTPCYRCCYSAPPPTDFVPSGVKAGLLGVLPGILGCMQAAETIKLILNIGSNLLGRMLTIDTLTMRFQELPLKQNPDCSLCG